MSDTQNKWIPVSERLPGLISQKLIRTAAGTRLAYLGEDSVWRDPHACCDVNGVTHWMDLPEPPTPPKPADPFEAWWWLNRNAVKFCMGDARLAWDGGWDAAKDHYAKPLPDFETWWNEGACLGQNVRTIQTVLVHKDVVKAIWNAAQGKP